MIYPVLFLLRSGKEEIKARGGEAPLGQIGALGKKEPRKRSPWEKGEGGVGVGAHYLPYVVSRYGFGVWVDLKGDIEPLIIA